MSTALTYALLALDLYVLYRIFQSSESNDHKMLWCLLVVLAPVAGLLIWMVWGPKR
jgi:hypothetical protein